MRSLEALSKVIGYIAVAVSALMFFLGDIGVGIMMLAAGLFLLWIAPRIKAGASVARQRTAQPEYHNVDPQPSAQPQQPIMEPQQAGPIYLTRKQREKAQIRERKQAAAAQGVACCPKCGSTSLTANKKGFGIGKAAVGAWAVGGLGIAAGELGRQKVLVTCLNCGHQFKPGKK